MSLPIDSIDAALSSVVRLRRSLAKGKAKQVSAREEQSNVKAACLAWFNAHRASLIALHSDTLFQSIDRSFQDLLEFTGRATSRCRYKDELKHLKNDLVRLRSQAVVLTPTQPIGEAEMGPPDFSRLIAEPRMQSILERRWEETRRCMQAGAYLAATVLMGSLLEALLLARTNALADKSPVFTSKCAPKDPKTGKTRPQQEWTLNAYIDVAHDLKWIRRSARDVGVVLRDYRNYVHPEKEFTHGVTVEKTDAQMFWAVFTQLSEQIIGK